MSDRPSLEVLDGLIDLGLELHRLEYLVYDHRDGQTTYRTDPVAVLLEIGRAQTRLTELAAVLLPDQPDTPDAAGISPLRPLPGPSSSFCEPRPTCVDRQDDVNPGHGAGKAAGPGTTNHEPPPPNGDTSR